MLQRLCVRRKRGWVLWVCAFVGLLALACAAPAPPQATVRELAATPAPVVYVSQYDGTAEFAENRESILNAVAAFGNSTPVALGSLGGMQRNYWQGVGLDAGDDALKLSPELNFSEDALPALLTPLVIGRSSIACVEWGEQAFWAIDQAAVAAIHASAAVQNPAVAKVLADCSQVAEALAAVCPDCGCGGPMGGVPPRCPTPWMSDWNLMPFISTPTPTP